MTVSTNDWDTVSAVRITSMNKKMTNSPEKLPSNFSVVNEAEMFNAEGDFSDWQISSGGDGHLIGLCTNVKNLKCAHALFGSTSGDATWSLFVSLNYVGGKTKGNIKVMNLVIKDDGTDPKNPVVSSRKVTLGSNNQFEFPDGTSEEDKEELKSTLCSLLETVLTAWLTENIKQFQHIFNQVNLNLLISSDDTWGWLKPTYIDYAYTENTKEFNQSIFSVLCMVNNHSVKNQPVAAEEQVIPENQEFGFLINEERYIEDLLVPGILDRFPDANKEDIKIERDLEGNQYRYEAILNPSTPLKLDPVEQEGKTYTPKLEKATFSLENTHLIVEMETSTWLLSGDATGHTIMTQPFHMEIVKSSKGKTIEYTKDTEGYSESNYVTGAPADTLPKWLSVLLDLIGLVFDFVLPKLGSLIAMIIIGVLGGLFNFINDWNAINSSTAPNVQELIDHVLNEIKWANQTVELNVAEFFGAIRLGGNLA